MKRPWTFPIENKILIPFVCISLITVACFCFILYRTEYDVKIETEAANAQALVDSINADINTGGYWQNPDDLLTKYEATYRGDSLFLYAQDGTALFGRRIPGNEELVLQNSSSNRLGWRIQYSLDRHALREAFIEEQRYMILAAVAMLLIIVQASVLIAYNISAPIRQLSEFCTRVSRSPDRSEDLAVEYTLRRDEVGQLAVAFQSMMESLRRYTGELTRIKALNESIVENLPLGVAVYDREGRLVFQNARADAMLSQEEERDSSGRILRHLLMGMVRRDDVLPPPARLRDKEGRIRDYEFGAWKLRSPDEADWGTLCTIDDVTYKKHMEEKLSRDEKLAYTGQLAADVAHEIRNPLAGIRAGLQVLGRKLSEERDQLLCREMVREVDRVNLLIENLLNLSRKRESEKTTVSLNALCDELLMLYFKVAENKGISLSVEVAGELWLFADEQELRQILINLINNSIKAMPDGGNVTLIGRPAVDGVAVTVCDNGKGMDPATLECALTGEGGGLGLAIVQRLLRQNSGTLNLFSAPGQGTQVELTFHGTGGEP
ncbi:MAG: ATP-binding protein [Pseudoflavonifractor sp.]|nr:ATP-binding protein [Pseudoflavonifractor sp.]